MSVFRSIVFSAVVSGALVGAAVTVAQQLGTVPLIQKGEVYERAGEQAAAKSASAAPAAHGDHEHDATAWEPREGFERNAFTAGANILTAIGFALLLAGIFSLRGRTVTWHEGLLWGLSGFVVFTVAPGLGLPPELPGVPAAPLVSRQLWWAATAAATAAGLALVFFKRSPWAAAIGLCLIALPHLIGAPHLEHVHTDVPAALSRQFVAAVTLTSLLFWALLGTLTGIVYRRISAA
jgi:cobalt transporter subunit CbtA